MLRLPLAASASAESALNLFEVVTTTDDENRRRLPRTADVIDSRSFVSLAVYGIDDGERRTGREGQVDSPCHLNVRVVAHAIVGVDVDREPSCALDPFREDDPQVPVHVAASDQRAALRSVEAHGGGGLAGCRQSRHQDHCRHGRTSVPCGHLSKTYGRAATVSVTRTTVLGPSP